MQLDIYQAETERLVFEQTSMLDDASKRLVEGQLLSPLEQAGVLHALQVLIENAIGKAKRMLSAASEPVPVSAYDAFARLARAGHLKNEELPQWNDIVGIRNRIVHDYMNIDMNIILDLVRKGKYHFVAEFLMRPMKMAKSDGD